MSVKDRNPFGPDSAEAPSIAKADIGVADPFHTPQHVIKCPICAQADPDKIQTQSLPGEVRRVCTICGNRWSGGSLVGGSIPRPLQPEDEDIPDDIRLSGTEKWFE